MHFQENHVILYVFLYDVIFLVFVFLRFLCKFSIISELSFMQWSLYCTILHYATLHFFQLLKKHRFCIHFFSWGLSDPKWPRNNKNNRFLKKKFHDPRETQKFCFLATCHILGHVRRMVGPSVGWMVRNPFFLNAENERFSSWKSLGQPNIDIGECVWCAGLLICAYMCLYVLICAKQWVACQ